MKVIKQILILSTMVCAISIQAFNFETVQQKVVQRYHALFSSPYPHQTHDICLQQYEKYKDATPARFNYYMRQCLMRSAASMPKEVKRDTQWMAMMYDANMSKHVNHIKQFEVCAKSVNDSSCRAFLTQSIEQICAESKILQDKKEAYAHRNWLPTI